MVSGSYDGTIIVWKRQLDGRWVLSLKLSFPDALRDVSCHPIEGVLMGSDEMGGRVFNLR